MREIIHFAHGNGFPSLTYSELLRRLETQYDLCYIDRIGHNPDYPVTDNWEHLVAEVIDSVRQQSKKPVIAVGHSLGGVLSLVAAIEQPQLFKSVIMIDSPLLGPVKSTMLRLAKALGVIDRITPAFRTRGRRIFWKNREDLIVYLKSRDLFKTFTEQCLKDYIDYGLDKNEEGYFLRFNRHIEYMIYRTIPHGLGLYEGQLKIPASVIYGNKSTVVYNMDIRYMKRHYQIEAYQLPGTHMLPFEDPEGVAEMIFSILHSNNCSASNRDHTHLP